MTETSDPTRRGESDMAQLSADAEFAKMFATLREQFRSRLTSDALETEQLAAELRSGNEDAVRHESLRRLFQVVHTLAGTAGTFGYANVSAAAHEFEGVIGAALEGPEAALAPCIASAVIVAQICRASAKRC